MSMLSFIIPAHNEAERITSCVSAIRDAATACGLDHEIIVVADACTDNTADLARDAGARVLTVDHRHIAATRNSGARAANGDRFIFVDADTWLSADVLRAAIAALDRGCVGGGCGVVFDAKTNLIAACFVFTWNMLARILRWAAGCFVFVRRDAFEAVGGFNENYFVSEEIFLSSALKRLGPFTVLYERITTSARKMQMYPVRKWLPHVIRLMFAGPRAYRDRSRLWLWYPD